MMRVALDLLGHGLVPDDIGDRIGSHGRALVEGKNVIWHQRLIFVDSRFERQAEVGCGQFTKLREERRIHGFKGIPAALFP